MVALVKADGLCLDRQERRETTRFRTHHNRHFARANDGLVPVSIYARTAYARAGSAQLCTHSVQSPDEETPVRAPLLRSSYCTFNPVLVVATTSARHGQRDKSVSRDSSIYYVRSVPYRYHALACSLRQSGLMRVVVSGPKIEGPAHAGI
ncbi:hypothetical protein PLICRDRAFT_34049 [Plicaturopsis crispa FD-325 SS-3]|nr:hypothetical protein PLICRDRAFT_34049 [Plicaturopsis crispa FD-325 SS-3]